MPSNLHHRVTAKLNVEITQEGLFGPFASTTTPLTQTFTSTELAGHPLTLAHLVQSRTEGFVLSATTNTYTPFLIVAQDDLNLGDNPTTEQPHQGLFCHSDVMSHTASLPLPIAVRHETPFFTGLYGDSSLADADRLNSPARTLTGIPSSAALRSRPSYRRFAYPAPAWKDVHHP